MLFGVIDVTREMLLAGGITLALLMTFQVLQGLRKIKFKGRTHLKVHKAVAWVIVVASVFHVLAALTFLGFIG